jgi:hypothetical protein
LRNPSGDRVGFLQNELTTIQEGMHMKLWQKLGIIVLISVTAVLTTLACLRHRYPVLLHLFSSCACTDYSDEVTGLTVFNPFRDRSPEASANAFLEEIKQGRCPVMAPNNGPVDCSYLLNRRRSSEWRLKNRRDQPHRISLFYQFTPLNSQPHERWAGEGMVEVVNTDGVWKASAFDVE